jgi:hypothetical protein
MTLNFENELNTADSDWQETRLLVREGAPQRQHSNLQRENNIWPQVPEWTWHQDILTDRPTSLPLHSKRTPSLSWRQLVNRLCPSRCCQLLTLEEMSAHKPLQFLWTSGASYRIYRTTSCSFSGPAGYPRTSNHSHRYSRDRAGRCGPLCRSHHRGRLPVYAREH